MNPNKALWEQGDFTRIAQAMRGSGESLVKSIGVAPGMRVLDLGCGDGTTALPAARLGADVLGVDIADNLVAAGNRRAHEAGLSNAVFSRAMPRICATWPTAALTSSSACSARYSRRGLSTWPKKWCA